MLKSGRLRVLYSCEPGGEGAAPRPRHSHLRFAQISCRAREAIEKTREAAGEPAREPEECPPTSAALLGTLPNTGFVSREFRHRAARAASVVTEAVSTDVPEVVLSVPVSPTAGALIVGRITLPLAPLTRAVVVASPLEVNPTSRAIVMRMPRPATPESP